MNNRKLYLAAIFFLSLTLFYQYSSEQRLEAENSQVVIAEESQEARVLSANDDYVYLEDDLLSLKISSVNGAIVEARSKKHLVESVEGSLGVRIFGSDVLNDFKYYFKTGFLGPQRTYVFDKNIDKGVVLLSDDGAASKTIRFGERPYELIITDSLLGGKETAGRPYASLYRSNARALDMNFDFVSGGFINRSSYEAYAMSTSQDSYEADRLKSVDGSLGVTSAGGWIGFTQKYFLAALLGSDDHIYAYKVSKGKNGLYNMGYTVEPGDFDTGLFSEHSHTLFLGPKVRKDLVERADNLEQTIEMGWFWFISQPMVWLLDKIYGFVGSWGWSVVIITLLLKVVLWPVTGAGFRSMANMKKIQPEMKEIQQRYANDRQKLGAEMMALYKKHKVNPAGGCLPLLAQMPFFIAFFFGLREMVELRQASFFWLDDLSAPDPYFILPIMFGLIMVLTQKLNPQAPNMDPTQAQVMKVMPVLLSVFFIVFPSSLALYSVVNSGVSLLQQRYLYSKHGGDS
jgi:YidC/Oxa1 family membrane protein insertase